MPEQRDISLTFLKGMSVLKAFDENQTHMSLADIARQTDLDPATARRLVLTLVHLGYVKKENRQFSLTPRILVLGAGFLRGNQFGKLVQPILNSHSSDLGLGISLAVRDEDHALLLAQSTLRGGSVTHGFTVGSRLPLSQTALGRMLLAAGPIDKGHTPFGDPELQTVLKKTIKLGYCIADSSFEAGVTGIAVPIGTVGDARAVLGVSDLSTRLANEETLLAVVNTLRRCALELSRANLF